MRLLLFLLAVLAPAQARAGKLDEVRDAVQGDSDDNDSDDDDDDDDDDLDDDLDDDTTSTTTLAKGPLDAGFKISAEYAYDVGAVHRPGFAAVLDTSWFISLDTSWTFLLEPLPGRIDHLVLGDADLCIRLVAGGWMELRTGIGARLMLDMGRIDAGFNYTLVMYMFPWKHLVISLDGDLGTLGRAFVSHGRVTLGGRIGVLEIFAGYDVMLIGDVPFHGPVAGVQVWL